MPQVDLYPRGGRVRPEPRPDASRQHPTDTYGSAGGPVGDAVAGVGAQTSRLGFDLLQQMAQERERARQQAAEVESTTAERQLGELTLDLKRRIDSTRGKDTLGLRDVVIEEYDKRASEIGAALQSPRVQTAFTRARDQRKLSLVGDADGHTSRELDQYEQKEAKAALETSVNVAVAHYDQPTVAEEELTLQGELARRHARTFGLGPEATAAMLAELRSNVRVGVIGRFVALNQMSRAQFYYDAYKGEIAADKQADLERTLRLGTVRGEALTHSEAILAAGGTLTEQRAKAKEIADDDVRELVLSNLASEAAVKAAAERDQLESDLNAAYNLIDQHKSVKAIPNDMWVRLGTRQPQLLEYEERRRRGVPIQTNDRTYYTLMTMAGKEPEKFVALDLFKYRTQLDDGAWDRMIGLQLGMRQGETKKTAPILDDFRTENQVIDQVLRRARIDPSPDEKSEAAASDARFRGLVAEQVRRLQGRDALTPGTGKKATNADIEEIATRILGQTYSAKTWYGGITTKRAIDMQIGDVPAKDQSQIRAVLRLRGNNQPSDEQVIEVYIENLMRSSTLRK